MQKMVDLCTSYDVLCALFYVGYGNIGTGVWYIVVKEETGQWDGVNWRDNIGYITGIFCDWDSDGTESAP